MTRDERQTGGVIYVEFLMAFFPIFLMFCGMVQAALMYAGGLAVQRSANTAARAAMVVLDDNPRYYGGAERLSLTGGSGGSTIGGVAGFLGGLIGGGGGGGGGGDGSSGGARMDAIRSAASIPLMAMAPTPQQVIMTDLDETVGDAIGDPGNIMSAPASRAASALLYNELAMAVVLPDGVASAEPRRTRVRVSYLFRCSVPIANRLMCTDGIAIAFGADAGAAARAVREISRGRSVVDSARVAWSQRSRDGRRLSDDETGVDDIREHSPSWALALAGGVGQRFKVISAEATLPVPVARYEYR